MARRIDTVYIHTLPVDSFAPDIQTAFAMVCQYIDYLAAVAGVPCHVVSYSGSESWGCGDASHRGAVVAKALPWDKRMSGLSELCPRSIGGVAVLVRHQFLTACDMQVLWEELDDAYPPAPKLALYAPIPQQDKLFHLIRLRVGEGCDLRLLPGVNCNTVPQRAANRTETGVMASGTPLTCQKQGGSGVSGVDHDRLAGVLKALFDRASRA